MSTERDPVDVLAEEFAARLRRGERPSVSDYAAAHPEHADQIRQVLPAVAQMEQLKNFRRSTPGVAAESLPDRLGDFRIVKELGRGGMGVVFEAVQESLGRRVALKVLASHAQLDPEKRERFVREAKAAARLHHTNIVPVFGVGEQDGLPYYVMQLIPGDGLNRIVAQWREISRRETKPVKAQQESTVVLDEDRSPRKKEKREAAPPPPAPFDAPLGDWNFIANIGIQVADALHYAHQHGVLHRDVKPANLLLDEHDEVWVVDFGLAKLANYRGITATGHIVGTLQYMAPECLNGAADARSDVYGLGATLYELLTLAPPFDGDSPAAIMKKIADSHPLAPRRLNPNIPRDLETIILKAMAREPARRYATAKLLAEDLQAFLEDRPISARRETLAQRASRWARHHPATAVLSCCTAAALILAAVVGWIGYAETKSALADKQKALEAEARKRDEAVEASAKLQANLALSLEAFEKVFVAAGGDDFRPAFNRGGPPPGGPFANDAADKAAVLEAVLSFYDKFAEQNATNAALRFEAAKAHRRVGEMHQIFGRTEKAAVAFRRASELLASVKKDRGNEPDVRFETMQLNGNLALGSPNAELLLKNAAELGDSFNIAPRRWAVATIYLKLGWTQELAKKNDEALASYRKAEALYALESGVFRPPHLIEEQASARLRQGVILTNSNNFSEARRVLEKSIEELKPISMGGPGHRSREAMGQAMLQLSAVLFKVGEEATAARYRAEAQRLLDGPKGFDGPPPRKDGKDSPPPPREGPFPKDGPFPKAPDPKSPKGK